MTIKDDTATAPADDSKVDQVQTAEHVDTPAEPEKPKEVTEDQKAFQRLEMKTSNAIKLLNQLVEKQAKGEEPTPKERKKLEQTREFLKKQSGEYPSDEEVRGIAETVVETTDETLTRLEKLERELSEDRAQGQAARAELNWLRPNTTDSTAMRYLKRLRRTPPRFWETPGLRRL